MSECRDPKTAGRWDVISEVCQPGRVLQATAENNAKSEHPTRGLHLYSRRVGGHG